MDDNKLNNYIDLFYKDGLYYVFNEEINDLTSEGYEYLLTLEGKVSNDDIVYNQVILANDSRITFDDVVKDMASSDKTIDNKK